MRGDETQGSPRKSLKEERVEKIRRKGGDGTVREKGSEKMSREVEGKGMRKNVEKWKRGRKKVKMTAPYLIYVKLFP